MVVGWHFMCKMWKLYMRMLRKIGDPLRMSCKTAAQGIFLVFLCFTFSAFVQVR